MREEEEDGSGGEDEFRVADEDRGFSEDVVESGVDES